jgi:hypothetical protein
LGSFVKINKKRPNLRPTFSTEKSYVLIWTKKLFSPHFGRLFNKLIWSPCFHRRAFVSLDRLSR